MRSRTAALVSLALVASIASTAPGGATASQGTLTLGGVECNLIPVPAGGPLIPLGSSPCGGVRPGAIVRTTKGMCTLNFVFKGSDGRTYVGTAGHCILGEGPFQEDVGEAHWAKGRGPVATDASGRRIGEIAYAVLKSPKDFALIRLDHGIVANPGVCFFGGPTSINKTRGGALVLHHFGNGLLIGDVLPARTSFANTSVDWDHIFANGAAVQGDSGSGVIDSEGRAVGVLVTIGFHKGSTLNDAGLIGITRLKPQIDAAKARLKVGFTLQTAPF